MLQNQYGKLTTVLGLGAILLTGAVAPNTAYAASMDKPVLTESAPISGMVTLYVGDKPVCILKSAGNFESLKSAMVNQFQRPDREIVEATFEPGLRVEKAESATLPTLTVEEAMNLLKKGGSKITTYTVQEEDSVNTLVTRYGMESDDFFELNPGVEKLTAGMTVQIRKRAPLVDVLTEESYVETKAISYPVVETVDASLNRGSRIVDQAGVEGIQERAVTEKRKNGIITETEVIKDEVVKEPVPEHARRGTMEWKGTGFFHQPASGRFTSPFGPRWGRMHRGIDIAGPIGTPITASDRGVVVKARNYGSYGNYIEIDHKNGYTTLYAHLSAIDVAVGDEVEQGQLIGKMGSTGRSTGSHLHFEVRHEGVHLDPMNFIINPHFQ